MSAPSPSLTLAGREDLARAWPHIALPMTTYMAACGWAPPSEPSAAAAWLYEGGRLPFLEESRGLPVVGVIGRTFLSDIAQLTVLSTNGADLEWVESLVRALVEAAFHQLGFLKCEWRVLDPWTHARSAATRLGFREEARLDGACFWCGGYTDLLLFGLLAEEWKGPAA